MPKGNGWKRQLRVDAFGIRHVAFGILLIALAGCGKKGPPLAPLLIVPSAVTDVSASRFGDQVIIRFTPPGKNTNNSTPADLARVDVYALSVEREADVPDGANVVRDGVRVGSIEIAPKPSAGEGAAEEPTAPRVFSETLTAEAHKTWEPGRGDKGSKSSIAARGAAETIRARGMVVWIGPIETVGAAGVAIGEQPPQPVRLYAFVPISGRGRRGALTTAVVPLSDAPAAPATPFVTYTETAIGVTWVVVEGVKGYNVYERGSTGSTDSRGSTGSSGSMSGVPLNAAPLKEPAFEDKRLEFGKARCYSVTSVGGSATRRVESPMSDPACVTPVDTFGPPAPTGLAAVAGPGTISLIWDAVTSGDLAGYVILRANAPDGTLQALTPEPIKETTYRDAAVTPGARYAYVVLAVDKSNNRSAPSARVEETAR